MVETGQIVIPLYFLSGTPRTVHNAFRYSFPTCNIITNRFTRVPAAIRGEFGTDNRGALISTRENAYLRHQFLEGENHGLEPLSLIRHYPATFSFVHEDDYNAVKKPGGRTGARSIKITPYITGMVRKYFGDDSLSCAM